MSDFLVVFLTDVYCFLILLLTKLHLQDFQLRLQEGCRVEQIVRRIRFGVFFGFLGIMLAVPLTALGVVLISEMYIKDFLGDRLWNSLKDVNDEGENLEELLPSPD